MPDAPSALPPTAAPVFPPTAGDTGASALARADAGIFVAWLNSTDDGAVAVDALGAVVLHNPAASRVTGFAPAAALRRPWLEVLRLDPTVAEALWGARRAGQTTHLVADVLCAQGNLRSAEISASPWHDAAGQTGILVVIRDLAILCRQRTATAGREGYGSLVGAHPTMSALFDLIDAVAPSDASVIIEGETGTGKELVAQLLHARSRRAERPLIAVNCAALAAPALESELFGQARGVHGGVAGSAIGRFELAHTGTLFLDEVGELPPAAQVKLLRFLQSGEFERVGDPARRRADARILAASSRPLEREVQDGHFREDLYYRLKVVRIQLPPLRERATDVPLLADHFLARHGAPGSALSPAAVTLLQAYRWPGNVRELENAVRHAIASVPVGAPRPVLGPELFPADLRAPEAGGTLVAVAPLKEDRRTLLLRALSAHGGNRTAAARALGIGRATFYRWWNEVGLGAGGSPES